MEVLLFRYHLGKELDSERSLRYSNIC
jgi:hypothetical protein